MPVPLVVAEAAKRAAKAAAKAAAKKAAAAAKLDRAQAAKRKAVIWVLVMVPVLSALMALGFGGSSPASSTSCGPGVAVPASADLDPALLGAINALKADYESAGAATDVSWALLAGVDYREDGNDPGASALSGEPLGTTNPDGGGVMNTKAESLIAAGNHIKAMASSVYGVALTATSGGDDVKKALLAYNRGFIYQRVDAPVESSPYVMNNYDDAHQNMVFPPVPGEPLAGMTDTRPGGFTIFTRLGGSAAGGASCAGLSGNSIVAIAQSQIGHAENPKGCNCGPEVAPYLGSDPPEAWCADFVSWTFWQAGRPFSGGNEGWRYASVDGLRIWLITNGVFGDAAGPPQPGDVVIYGGSEHTGLVESFDGTTATTIEGNYSDQVGRSSFHPGDPNVTGWGRQVAPV